MSKYIFGFVFGTAGVILATRTVHKPPRVLKDCDCHDYCNGTGYVSSQKGDVFGHNGYLCACRCH